MTYARVILNIVGTSRAAVGDESGIADLEQALEIGLELSLASHLHRTYHNLMESHRQMGRLEKSAEALAAERRSDERFGHQQQLRWVLGEEALDRYWRGDWETALARVDEFMAEIETGSPHYQEPLCRWVRGHIALARGDMSGADEDTARTVDLAGEQKDLQVLAPALAQRAFALIALGRSAEASGVVNELLALPLHYSSFIDLAWALSDLGRGAEFEQRAADIHSTPWRSAALAIAAGRFEAAADVLRGDGRRLPTRPMRGSGRATTTRYGARSPSTARSERPGTSRRERRCSPPRHEHGARGAQGRHRPLLRPGRVHVPCRKRHDPEDVAAVLRGYHGHVASELERFGGTVEKFIGDAVMALFGAPIAHEDDPERAVRAALAIRDWAQERGRARGAGSGSRPARRSCRWTRVPSRGRGWRPATS